MADTDFRRQLKGLQPDRPNPLSDAGPPVSCCKPTSGRDYDLHPMFPRLKSFLDFWTQNLEGRLHKVLVAHSQLIRPSELKLVTADFKLN
jgi:hypothetical protein